MNTYPNGRLREEKLLRKIFYQGFEEVEELFREY